MTGPEVERFFAALAKAWPHPTDCILVGGAAAVLDGGARPTGDVDFEVRFGGKKSVEDPEVFAGAIRKAEAVTGISGQFMEDLGAMSVIAMPSYRPRKRKWKQFGRIRVCLLDPADYVVSKLRRGLAHDFTDLLLVALRHRVSWRELAARCAGAVRASYRSTRLRAFEKRAEYLFREHGRALWGARYDPAPAVSLFRRLSSRRS